MRIFDIVIGFIAFACLAAPGFAQSGKPDIVGRWQGTLNNGQTVRVVMIVTKTKDGHYAGERYLIDRGVHPVAFDEIDMKDGVFTFKQGGLSYRGELSADGQHIKGTPFDFDRAPKTGAWALPPTPHTTKTVTTDDGVKLEVLDFGGSGPPLVFIAGLGADGHAFDVFAPKFTAKHHVYSLTRRGYGASDKPDPSKASYAADRLADDVLQVMMQLKIEKPALAGWSLGGEELSGVATKAPDRVTGLVYLDAAYVYAFYAPGAQVPAGEATTIALNAMKDRLRILTRPSLKPAEAVALLDDVMAKDLKALETDLEATRAYYKALTPPDAPPAAIPAPGDISKLSPADRVGSAVLQGGAKYTGVKAPVLAFYALPGIMPARPTEAQLAEAKVMNAAKEEQAKHFEAAHPGGKVVRLANAQHAVYQSHPDEVFAEMDAFLDKLPH